MRHGSRWVALVVLVAGATLGGCGEATECDEALDKLTGECEMGAGASIDGTLGECEDVRRCVAKCIVKSKCKDITDPNPEPNRYDECVGDCYAQPTP